MRDLKLTRRAVIAAGGAWPFIQDETRARTATLASRAISIEACIEARRAMYGPRADGGDGYIFPSPDASRYALMCVSGDLVANANRIQVFAGQHPESVATARAPICLADLQESGLGAGLEGDGLTRITAPGLNPLVWAPSGDRIALLWPDAHGVVQVLSVDAENPGNAAFLTQHRSHVQSFYFTPDGALLYFADPVFSDAENQRLIAQGFTLEAENLMDVVSGNLAGTTFYDRVLNRETFFKPPGPTTARKIDDGRAGPSRFPSFFKPTFSSDGRFALIDATPARIDPAWARYQDPFLIEQVNASLSGHIDGGRRLLQVFLVDLQNARAAPLLDVPMTTRTGTLGAFSPDATQIVLGPSFLPIGAGEHTGADVGIKGEAFAIVDREGRVGRRLDLPSCVEPRGVTRLAWTDAGIELGDEEQNWLLDARMNWRELQAPSPPKSAATIELAQDLNHPPVVTAIERDAPNRRTPLLDLNPGLANARLGRVEYITWPSTNGRNWRGLLYHPVDARRGERYPLVIQTHGHAPVTEFSLTGKGAFQPGLGPSYAVDIAQPLAARGVAVLHIEDQHIDGVSGTERESAEASGAFEGAVRHLDSLGLIRADRVGLNGYSRTGWHVEWALAFGDVAYAAAIVFDNMDAGYFQAGVLSWARDYTEDNIGAAPFADGLAQWLERSPPFAAERVVTPLQMFAAAGGLTGIMFSGWEMFTRLRRLQKPVELFVVPRSDKGSHGLQNPRQCQIVQNRALDWWLYWLLGEQNARPDKAAQYQAWARLTTQLDLTREQPRPPRLNWSASAQQ